MNEITIDGSVGEGGGQVLRTALTLSLITRKRLSITKIRAGREKPGLLRQHLTCVKAAQRISSAAVDGDFIGSQELVFSPGDVKSGSYSFEIGSAGSTSLVLQTIFLPLSMKEEPSEVHISGGTHNKQAPTFEFLNLSYLPLLRLLGFNISIELIEHGFYPAGGGQVQAKILKRSLVDTPFDLCLPTNGPPEAYAVSANLPERIGIEELRIVGSELQLPGDRTHYRNVKSNGPGNIMSVQWKSGFHSTVVSAFGAPGIPLEKVAADAIAQTQRLLASKVPVDSLLADQLLLPLSITQGGRFATLEPTEHFRTNAAVITQVLGAKISSTESTEGKWIIEVIPNSESLKE